MHFPALLAVAGVVLFAFSWMRYIGPAIGRARAYMKNMSTCGFVPPPPSRRGTRFLYGLSKVLSWIQVGRIRYIGRDNLKLDGPFIVAPNHPHYIDPAVIVLALNR